MKVKDTKHTGIKSLLSMLSIILVFAAVCALCIFLLNKAGVINVDWLRSTEAEETTAKTGPDIPLGEGHNGTYSEIVLDDTELRAILDSVPFYDTFYFRVYVTYVGKYGFSGVGANYKVEVYDIYKDGEKYKIITYNDRMRTLSQITCDGESVELYDYETKSRKLYPVSEDFTFGAQAPLPDFAIFTKEEYDVLGYYGADDEYVITCRFDKMNLTDEIHVDGESGLVTYFKSIYDYLDGKYSIEYSLSEFAVGTGASGHIYTPADFAITK
ncbi:MAG: hypothetical protein KBS59_00415 [Clostridiales bacterium]|nr:hypothetical protein [Clostridiales bacterium]